MKYCVRCGNMLQDDAKFCAECGTPVNESAEKKRENKDISKCPACGARIPSFTVVCPECGHELNQAKVPDSVKEFSEKINACDYNIAQNPPKQKGLWSWGAGKWILWIILNLITCFLPMFIYFIVMLISASTRGSLTNEEKVKEQLVSNYPFPNNREDLLEGLLFIETQMEAIASQKITNNSLQWIKIWKNKAEQLYQKMDVMLKGDPIAEKSWDEINIAEKTVKKKIYSKILIGLSITTIIMIVMLAYVGAKSCVTDKDYQELDKAVEKTVQEVNEPFDWPTTGLATLISPPPVLVGEIINNSEKSFKVRVNGVTQEQYDAYVLNCTEKGFKKGDGSSGAYHNDDGYKLSLSKSDDSMTIGIEPPEKMDEIHWPTTGIASKIPAPESNIGRVSYESDRSYYVDIGNTSKEDFKRYVDACINAGFSVDYYRDEDSFSAKNKDKDSLRVSYKGNSVMGISVSAK